MFLLFILAVLLLLSAGVMCIEETVYTDSSDELPAEDAS